MKEQKRAAIATLLERLAENPGARLAAAPDGCFALEGAATGLRLTAQMARLLVSRGLLEESREGHLAATSTVPAWLKRKKSPGLPFRMQHGEIGLAPPEKRGQPETLLNLDESPLQALARRRDRDGAAWLPAHAVSAGERLRRDFEIGQLQPHVTANWSASVNMGKRTGNAGKGPELTDAALAARLRFERAMLDVGPELSGILIDVCCFLKGLEIVERERRWPARSAKLVLRLALASLARHYGLDEAASGRARSRGIRRWGSQDYRPEIG